MMQTADKLIALAEVLEVTGLTRRTLLRYESIGLIEPGVRQSGAVFYPERTVERVNRICRLRDDLGVNLAGVGVILEMRAKIEMLQSGLDEVVRFVHDEMRDEMERYCRRSEKAVIPRPLARPPRTGD